MAGSRPVRTAEDAKGGRYPIRGLFETQLTVRDLDRSIAFFRDVLGLPLAQIIPERNAAFFWVPTPDKAMLGLWSIGTSPLNMRLQEAGTRT